MAATYYFAIVGTKDSPLYETELTSSSKAASNFDTTPKDDHRHLNQFIIHSALDVVEEVQWNNQALYECSQAVYLFSTYGINIHRFPLLDILKSSIGLTSSTSPPLSPLAVSFLLYA
jgi:Sedlin, N-terminal conserved region